MVTGWNLISGHFRRFRQTATPAELRELRIKSRGSYRPEADIPDFQLGGRNY